MAEILNTFNFWRLFHCLLSHSTSEEESARTKATWSWMSDRYVTLKKIAGGLGGVGDSGEGLILLGIVWAAARTINDLPGIEIVLEKAADLDTQAEAVKMLLDEYKELAPQLKAHPVKDLDVVLEDCCTDWEKASIHNMLAIANRITLSKVKMGHGKQERTLSGPRDTLKYILQRIESGLLINQNQILRPINVNQEAKDIVDWYTESLKQKFLPTGLMDANRREVLLERTNFFGILGYSGDGKSTMARYILYQIAQAGFNCLHLSLENPGIAERNKFILLHAHNPVRFGSEFRELTYSKFKRKELSSRELDMLDEVGKDFEQTIAGQLIIEQAGMVSWETIKMKIEQHHMSLPLEAACVDYLQMIDPPNDRDADQRSRMTSMIKDVRQFQMTFDGGRGLCLISPVQSNEEGRKQAMDHDGCWSRSGVNNDKELARSMDYIVGIFNRGPLQSTPYYDLVMSFPKDRDAGDGIPSAMHMTGTGWILPGMVGGKREPDPNDEATAASLQIGGDVISQDLEFPA